MERPGPGPHVVTLTIDGQRVQTLADLPPMRDRLLFVGLNPSPVSVDAGHYHQGTLGRAFWKRLITARILPPGTEIETADDALVAAGHGITDLLKIPTARDEATDADLTAGIGPLWQKIALWRPAAVVFIYKRAASIAAGRPLEEPWGQLHRGRARRPAVLPDARPVRAGRIGRRGPEPPAQPRGVAAGGPGLGGRARQVVGGRGRLGRVVGSGDAVRRRPRPRRGARASSAAAPRTRRAARGRRSRGAP